MSGLVDNCWRVPKNGSNNILKLAALKLGTKTLPRKVCLVPTRGRSLSITLADSVKFLIGFVMKKVADTFPVSHYPYAQQSFRQSFTSNVNYLKRRFSSGDLSSECDDADAHVDPYTKTPPVTSQPQAPPPPPPSQSNTTGDLSLNLKPGSKTTSAPSSPAKSRESLLQRVQSLTGQARDQGAHIIGAAVSSATRVTSVVSGRHLTLLVIDDQNTDWTKYFRGKRIGEYEIKVEQAEFREITVTATSDSANVSMAVYRGGTRVGRSFRPDFLLVRQNLRDAGEDYKKLLLAMKFGGVPSINNLNSIYNFQDKPWVFGHLVQLQRRMGKEAFPLIEQTFYPDHNEMVSSVTNLIPNAGTEKQP
ncbi:synapsin [Rhynchophorus ferrugineus]|uniref:synapsin n=1 Tax=Rhynchophorus ferrugineus TaxID=354439 RepID=UPI003FCC30DC